MLNKKQIKQIIESGTQLFLSRADNETILRYQRSDKKNLELFTESTVSASNNFSANIYAECLNVIFSNNKKG